MTPRPDTAYNPRGKGNDLSRGRRVLVLTRSRENASFRQRIQPYLAPLGERGVDCHVEELTGSRWRKARLLRTARSFDGVWLHRKTLTAWDALCLGARRLIYDFDDAIMYQARSGSAAPDPTRLRRRVDSSRATYPDSCAASRKWCET